MPVRSGHALGLGLELRMPAAGCVQLGGSGLVDVAPALEQHDPVGRSVVPTRWAMASTARPQQPRRGALYAHLAVIGAVDSFCSFESAAKGSCTAGVALGDR
jgi:hypothetical protein